MFLRTFFDDKFFEQGKQISPIPTYLAGMRAKYEPFGGIVRIIEST